MTAYAVSLAGSVDTADQEAQLIEQLRGLVRELPNVSGAFAHTQQYGQVDLMTDAPLKALGDLPGPPAAADDTPDADKPEPAATDG